MKIALVSTLALLAASPLVAAQGADDQCIPCLQAALLALPACAKVDIKSLTSTSETVTDDLSACLCSSLDGAWTDSCKSQSKCDPANVSAFRGIFSKAIQDFGLDCTSTPTFKPPPPPTSTLETTPTAVPTSSNPGGNNGTTSGGNNGTNPGGSKGSSFGNKEAVPSLLLTQALGAVVVLAGISASIF
ncbi:hypothetical protein BGW38_003909 [Lunasporangiospora selenospora]|uniref:Extracellular membrane protein CFEM domain-containing protein n=1 Tax=Lunasporangiospora selenospora TaxID=979761 RepID=A0A9P6FQI0_9FUNG|nr:hypothetical protein BGW38_003909 [Lunasporangiospora selenospora]